MCSRVRHHIKLPPEVRLILETWRYIDTHTHTLHSNTPSHWLSSYREWYQRIDHHTTVGRVVFHKHKRHSHCSDVIMGAMVSQITSLTMVCSTVYSGADHRKHQNPASLAFVRGIHRWPVNSPHKEPVTREMFSLDNVIKYNCKFGLVVLDIDNFQQIADTVT